MEEKYYNVNKKYFADALAFLGFKYYKFDKADGTKAYSFEDTKEFQTAMRELSNLKKKYNNYEIN